MSNRHYKVCTRCIVYNHAKYIKDALHGFEIQETDFPVVYALIDDASTDGTQEIIKEYMSSNFEVYNPEVTEKENTEDYEKIFSRHKNNTNIYFACYFLKINHWRLPGGAQKKYDYIKELERNSDFTAMCEGDDYWSDSHKLQKQVLALETHPLCTMSFCKTIRVSALDNTTGSTIPLLNHIKEGYVTMDVYLKEQFAKGIWTFHTSSYLFNNRLIDNYNSEKLKFLNSFPYGDMAHVLWALMHGDVYYLDFIGGCYRVMSGGYNTMVKKDKEYAMSQSKRLIEGLEYFDNITENRYHKYVMTRIKHLQYYGEIDQGHHFVFLKPYYWNSYNKTFIKSRIRAFINNIKKQLN